MESNGDGGLGPVNAAAGSSSTKMEISILTLKKEFLPKIAWRSAAAAALGTTSDPSPASLPPQQTDRHWYVQGNYSKRLPIKPPSKFGEKDW